jgi:heme/copper-type cytochrome/quinol oxidase subunit 4
MEKRVVTLIALYLAPPFVLKTEVEITTVIVAAAVQGKIRIEAH